MSGSERRRLYHRKRLYFIAKLVVLAVCVVLIALCLYGAIASRSAWGGAKRTAASTLVLDAERYLEYTEQISDYGGARQSYRLPVLPISDGYQYLAVWLVHSYAQIWAGDTLLYETAEPEGFHIGHTPGCYWALVPLTEADRETELRLVVTPAYRVLASRTPQIYVSTRSGLLQSRMVGEKSLMIISLFCLIEGLLFSIFTLLLRVEGRTGQALFYMGLMIADLGLWKLADLPGVVLLYPQASLALTYLSYLAFMLIIPAVSCFLSWREERGGVYTVVCELFLIFDAVLLALHLLDISDLRENMVLFLLAFIIGITVIIVRSTQNLRKRFNDWQSWAVIVLAIAGILDFVIYYYVSNSLHLGITLTLMFFYGIINGVLVLSQVFRQRERLRQKDVELKEQRLALMMSQIRPHFLYNTLNTIRALCQTDGKAAEEMILDLSGYLRLNFERMDNITPVPFTEELAHTRFYLSIEQRRFPEELSVVYGIETEDFTLPALSLQPIVENGYAQYARRAGDGRRHHQGVEYRRGQLRAA